MYTHCALSATSPTIMATAGNDGTSIAITGLSCRFPGDGDNPGNYWKLVCEGKCQSQFHAGFAKSSFEANSKQRHGRRYLKSALMEMLSGLEARSVTEVSPKVVTSSSRMSHILTRISLIYRLQKPMLWTRNIGSH